ncbi:hypothetical protein QBL02_13120 [Leucobacter sp. UT-8R-CII-1-4]|uniref:hypothetical protein n=1 Tax=Leucobacter sp. UT-8R-CII-1-4 TaxID=3040075 RepID=UPI0024A848E9|nr:hypothetical protein [Leucobacter sp. UT-8R-CII-1-4]MDI6024482.1 hypothetical protein [Leucobacter sp. UT-8R-CII-1-4]
MKKDEAANLLDAVGQAASAVAALTGIKKQFVDSGWNEHNAERMVYALMMQGAGDKK